MSPTRREFLKFCGATLAVASNLGSTFRIFEPVIRVENPLAFYPDRDWERTYRDIANPDSSFVFLCAPNDTHNCLLRAQVKNGVITRIDPTYGYGKATDIYGVKTTHRWDPRCCNKGLAMMRRFYGSRRIKGPMIRKGYREWVRAGFPRDPETGRPPRKYFQRGTDTWIPIGWEEAADLIAQSLLNIAQTYSGREGRRRLERQGFYVPAMLEAMQEAGTSTLKFRGSMPFLAVTRFTSPYRMANAMALLDHHLRGVAPDQAIGGRGWDNYAFHTDLAPGHPMVTGQQNVDFDLCLWEYSPLILLWGMNPLTTKMPDCHWLTEAKAKGSKVIVISNDYCASAKIADQILIVRTGTDAALAYALAYVIMKERRFQERVVKSFTDLPLLVRMDTGRLLRAKDLFPNYAPRPLTKAQVVKPGDPIPPIFQQDRQLIPESLRTEVMNDFVVWDTRTHQPIVITRDDVGDDFWKLGVDPALTGTFSVQTVEGRTVQVRPLYEVYFEICETNYRPELAEAITGVPAAVITELAREIARHPRTMRLSQGMGVNQYFHADLKDRAMYLVCALTDNIGHLRGNIGSFAGNFRLAFFNGTGQYLAEDPFAIELDPRQPARVRFYWRAESAHYYSNDDRPLVVNEHVFTGTSHLPTPTKFMWFVDANSTLGNAKWGYNLIENTLPKIECIVTNDWWWTLTCEYSDIVLGVDAWHENRFWDLAGSVTNPFLSTWPRTGHPRWFDTKNDVETFALVGRRLAELTGDQRFHDYWAFALQGRPEIYTQRIIDASSNLRGYRLEALAERAERGIPSLLLTRSAPKYVGKDQTEEHQPWYTKSGRLEFYREEPEFQQAGENVPIYREPIDSTHYEPNVIVAHPHPLLHPVQPDELGLDRETSLQETDFRQARHIMIAPEKLPETRHPLMATFGARHIVHTPKYRHAVHTTAGALDLTSLLFGPFGDVYRHDTRMPYLSEGFIDVHPRDLQAMGIHDGDYVWVDADPQDRPFVGQTLAEQPVTRLMLRARAMNNTPPGVARIWFNMAGSSHGTVKGAADHPTGLAINPHSGYQALYRHGSHQSVTRAWLKPTYMTDTLVRKNLMGQMIGMGFAPDVHGPIGAPREALAKVTKAENGGLGGRGLWRPLATGFRPSQPHDMLRRYVAGTFVTHHLPHTSSSKQRGNS
ncbi:MAG: molybdopterin oxidoreductase [Nitrospirae bacterium]|nr:MAG: molybdopterin oxidoreductase [Nitrospirota bacterium]